MLIKADILQSSYMAKIINQDFIIALSSHTLDDFAIKFNELQTWFDKRLNNYGEVFLDEVIEQYNTIFKPKIPEIVTDFTVQHGWNIQGIWYTKKRRGQQ